MWQPLPTTKTRRGQGTWRSSVWRSTVAQSGEASLLLTLTFDCGTPRGFRLVGRVEKVAMKRGLLPVGTGGLLFKAHNESSNKGLKICAQPVPCFVRLLQNCDRDFQHASNMRASRLSSCTSQAITSRSTHPRSTSFNHIVGHWCADRWDTALKAMDGTGRCDRHPQATDFTTAFRVRQSHRLRKLCGSATCS